MFPEHFKRICEAMGKPFANKGILTPAELPQAIEKLQQAMDKSRQEREEAQKALDLLTRERGYLSAQQESALRKKAAQVPLATRAYPLLEMMQLAQKKNQEVVWGVDF